MLVLGCFLTINEEDRGKVGKYMHRADFVVLNGKELLESRQTGGKIGICLVFGRQLLGKTRSSLLKRVFKTNDWHYVLN